jgi:hypothetical protein
MGETPVRVTFADYMEGFGCLVRGEDWDGPWSRAVRRRFEESRQRGAALQAELAAIGANVSLELCRDAADNGWSDGLRRAALAHQEAGEEPTT